MYVFKIETHKSGIEGVGVFALEKIGKNAIVWKFDPTHDKSISVDEYNLCSKEAQDELDRVAYLSPTTGRYVYPPENDPARYTNHSRQNNLTVAVNKDVSDEPYFIANRDIDIGEELTNNYLEFDDALKSSRPKWI
jgi:SET domain-containing protein